MGLCIYILLLSLNRKKNGKHKKRKLVDMESFWILLGITAAEVLLGIFKVEGILPVALIQNKILGLEWLTHIFLILTLIKAAYIVMVFMHLGDETSGFKWTILLPAFVLVPYLIFIILAEVAHFTTL